MCETPLNYIFNYSDFDFIENCYDFRNNWIFIF